MKTLKLSLVVLALTLCAFTAHAVEVKSQFIKVTVLDDVALNAAAGVRTGYIGPYIAGGESNTSSGDSLAGYKIATLEGKFTFTNAGTLTLTCTAGGTQATADSDLTTCTVASGTCTINTAGVIVTASKSADYDYTVPVNIQGMPVVKCIIAHGGAPAAGDKYTLVAWLTAI